MNILNNFVNIYGEVHAIFDFSSRNLKWLLIFILFLACGTSTPPENPKTEGDRSIWGEVDAFLSKIPEFPWMVFIHILSKALTCGSLLNDRYVITYNYAHPGSP